MANALFDSSLIKVGQFTYSDHTNQLNDVVSKRTNFGGTGFISGQIPGIVTVDGASAVREIELRSRSNRKLIATTWSKPDGTYRFNDLSLNDEFDLIARDHQRVYSDVIVPAVFAWPHVMMVVTPITRWIFQGTSSRFRVAGGALPHSATITTPLEGVTISVDGQWIEIQANEDSEIGTLEFAVASLGSEHLEFQVDVAPPAAATSWRVNVGNSISYCAMTELEFMATLGGSNIATGGDVIASGKNAGAGHEPSNAFDGIYLDYSPTAVWASQDAMTGWIGYSWATPKEITEIKVGPRYGGSPQRIDIFYIEKQLTDGTWARVSDYSCQDTGWTEGQMRSFPVVSNIIKPVSYSASSLYMYSATPSYESLSSQRYADSSNPGTTWVGTESLVGSWIKAYMGEEPPLVDNVIVGGGTNPWFSNYSYNLNGCVIQHSDDDSTWTTVGAAISGAGSHTKDIIIPTGGVSAKYWRLYKSTTGYVITSQFRFTINP